MKQLK